MEMPESVQKSVFADVACHNDVISDLDGPNWYPASWSRDITLLQVVTPVIPSAGSRHRVLKHFLNFVKEVKKGIELGEIRSAMKLCNVHASCTALRDMLQPHLQIRELSSLRSENERVLSLRFKENNTHKAVVVRVHCMPVCSSSMFHSTGLFVSQMKAVLNQHRQRVRYFDADVAIDLTEMLERLSDFERACNPCLVYGLSGTSTAYKQKQMLRCDTIVYRRVKAWLERQSTHDILIHSCKKPDINQPGRMKILVRFHVYTIEAVLTLPGTTDSGNTDEWTRMLLQAAKAPRTLDLFLASRISLDASNLQVHNMWMDTQLDNDTREKLQIFLRAVQQFDSSTEHFATINALRQHKPNTIREWINSHRSVWYKDILCVFNFLFDKH